MPKPRVLIIYSGGTIGMIKDPKSGSLYPFDFDHLLEKIPELQLLDCRIKTVPINNPIDSSNMNPQYWAEIATIIEKRYNSHEGFVILHGSDTMSYTASALSFMFQNLSKPVILTGSQLPIGDLRTDAKENLITAIQLASLRKKDKAHISEVCLYFEYKLYRGNRTTKINAEHFEAFASLNYPELGESGVHLKINDHLLLKSDLRKPFKVHKSFEDRIILIKLFPGITESIIRAMTGSPDIKGVVLETYGAGNCTTESWFIDCLKDVIRRKIPIVNVTQCSGGSVLMGEYATSEQLKKIGLISAKDMTSEAAITKLMYLLGRKVRHDKIKSSFERSIRGEVT